MLPNWAQQINELGLHGKQDLAGRMDVSGAWRTLRLGGVARQLDRKPGCDWIKPRGSTVFYEFLRKGWVSSMLVLSRKTGEMIEIGGNITIVVTEIRGDKVRIAIDAPRDVTVHRKEVADAIRRNDHGQGGNGQGQAQSSYKRQERAA